MHRRAPGVTTAACKSNAQQSRPANPTRHWKTSDFPTAKHRSAPGVALSRAARPPNRQHDARGLSISASTPALHTPPLLVGSMMVWHRAAPALSRCSPTGAHQWRRSAPALPSSTSGSSVNNPHPQRAASIHGLRLDAAVTLTDFQRGLQQAIRSVGPIGVDAADHLCHHHKEKPPLGNRASRTAMSDRMVRRFAAIQLVLQPEEGHRADVDNLRRSAGLLPAGPIGPIFQQGLHESLAGKEGYHASSEQEQHENDSAESPAPRGRWAWAAGPQCGFKFDLHPSSYCDLASSTAGHAGSRDGYGLAERLTAC